MEACSLRWNSKMRIPAYDEKWFCLALHGTKIRGNAAGCSLAFFASFKNPLGLLDMFQKPLNLTHRLKIPKKTDVCS
jgi:hypothetical protein